MAIAGNNDQPELVCSAFRKGECEGRTEAYLQCIEEFCGAFGIPVSDRHVDVLVKLPSEGLETVYRLLLLKRDLDAVFDGYIGN